MENEVYFEFDENNNWSVVVNGNVKYTTSLYEDILEWWVNSVPVDQ